MISITTFFILSVWAAIEDLQHQKIPNAVSLLIVCLFLGSVPFNSIPLLPHLFVAILTLSSGFGLYTVNIFGAGDVKILSALALWAGPKLIIPFLAIVFISGGIFAVSRLIYKCIHGETSTVMPFGPSIAIGAYALYLIYLRNGGLPA